MTQYHIKNPKIQFITVFLISVKLTNLTFGADVSAVSSVLVKCNQTQAALLS